MVNGGRCNVCNGEVCMARDCPSQKGATARHQGRTSASVAEEKDTGKTYAPLRTFSSKEKREKEKEKERLGATMVERIGSKKEEKEKAEKEKAAWGKQKATASTIFTYWEDCQIGRGDRTGTRGVGVEGTTAYAAWDV